MKVIEVASQMKTLVAFTSLALVGIMTVAAPARAQSKDIVDTAVAAGSFTTLATLTPFRIGLQPICHAPEDKGKSAAEQPPLLPRFRRPRISQCPLMQTASRPSAAAGGHA